MREPDDRLDLEVREVYRRATPDAAATRRAIERVRRERGRPAGGWLFGPRRLALPPLAWAAAAVVLLAAGAALRPALDALRHAPAPRRAAGPVLPPDATAQTVEFVLVAPQASHVALVGDFNGWDPKIAPMRRVGARWVVTVSLAGGRHVYGFVVDGGQWVSDPQAPMTPQDAFGFRRSVVVVERPAAT